MAGDPKNASVAKKKSGGNIITLLLIVPLIFMFMPTFIFLTIVMMPSLVAFVVDRSKQRYGAITVGGMNFAGCFPWLMDLWLRDHSVPHVLDLLTNVWALIVIFGSAGLGWILSSTAPFLASTIMSVTSTHKIAGLQARQKQLLEEWGAEVSRADTGEDILAADTPVTEEE